MGTPIAVVVADEEDIPAFANFTLADAGGADQDAAVAPEPAAPPPPPPPPATSTTPVAPPEVIVTTRNEPVPQEASVTLATPAPDDLDGAPSWRKQVLQQSPLAAAMLAEQLAYEEQFGSTGMEPLERVVADNNNSQ